MKNSHPTSTNSASPALACYTHVPRHLLSGQDTLFFSHPRFASVTVLPKMGVSLTVIDPADCEELERILSTKVDFPLRLFLSFSAAARTREAEKMCVLRLNFSSFSQETTLFFSEQITNPLTRIIDTERIVALCK